VTMMLWCSSCRWIVEWGADEVGAVVGVGAEVWPELVLVQDWGLSWCC
jgi:hypothetical protein